ncbi:hypothetical protein NQ317_009383 [Molorchus minor]|uniref:Meckel syndrome type 1 protein n=1 Tax=Molorchus minor TaxID=1323400 RepID=A0ABQ9JQ41_9CUCU|nr:hypothetical protein NQ317_009383 [Molorchus minor]
MSSSKSKLTKYTGCYRSPDKISNLKLSIRYKRTEDDNVGKQDKDDDWRFKTFSWQEKRFSKYEMDYYREIHNCITDLEKEYHAKVIKDDQNAEQDPVVFSYIDEDGYISEQEVSCFKGYDKKSTYLQKFVEAGDDVNCRDNKSEFDYGISLMTSFEKTVIQRNFEKMYIMVDLGEYVENIWIKNEQVLCIVKYDAGAKFFSIYPDFTSTHPYYIKVQGETVQHFNYFIENYSATAPKSIEMTEFDLIKKLTGVQLTLNRQLVGDKFHLPPKNKLFVYVFFEILSAKNFEYPDVYIQYYIDLPPYWTCEDLNSLRGITQTCHGVNDENLVYFGHCFDVVLEYDIQKLQENAIPKSPYIYFEVISKSSWNRYRTEGLTYKNLPIVFGLLQNGPSGNLRRFFIGDCSNYKDITWIGIPKEHEGNFINKFGINTVGTGQIDLRMNVLHQSQAFLDDFNESRRQERLIYEKLNSSSLIKSVEQVLKAFRKARKNMLEVRKKFVKNSSSATYVETEQIIM